VGDGDGAENHLTDRADADIVLGMPEWEYQVIDIKDNLGAVRSNLAEWASAGWELVSASTWSSPVTVLRDGLKVDLWSVHYVHYWRRMAHDDAAR
jgi:hypothetical protein